MCLIKNTSVLIKRTLSINFDKIILFFITLFGKNLKVFIVFSKSGLIPYHQKNGFNILTKKHIHSIINEYLSLFLYLSFINIYLYSYKYNYNYFISISYFVKVIQSSKRDRSPFSL